MDPGCSPAWVFSAHPSDKVTQLPTDLGSPCPSAGRPTPIGPKARTVPAQDCLGFDHLRDPEQIRLQPSHPHQQKPIATLP